MTLNQGTSDIRLKDKKMTQPLRQDKWLQAATRKWCTAYATRTLLHVIRTHFMVKKHERCGLETVILTIPKRDSIRKEDVSSRLSSLHSDPTITPRLFAYLAQPSRILRCNARVWQMWRLSEPEKKKKVQPPLILIAIHWTKRRGSRLMTNLNIFIFLWYLPYAKRYK